MFIEIAYNNAEDDSDSPGTFRVVAMVFTLFFVVDFVIQSCIIKKSKPDCCESCCGCECGCFLVVKLIVDGFYLLLTILEAVTDGEDRDGIDGTGLFIFVKIGLEMAAIVLLCFQKNETKPPPEVQQATVGQTVVGLPVVVASKECDP
jgi:hypothetical protein